MLVRAGQGITRAAGVATEVYQRELREQNATRVTEALTQLTQFKHELTYGVDGDDSGWVSQQGKNALERPDGLPLDEDVVRRFRERMESLSLGLGNDAQRKLLQERAMAMETDLRGRVQQHVAQQGIQYRQDTLTGVIASGQRLMGTATDPLDIARAADMTRQAASQLADMRGLADEQRDDFYREMLTPGHLGALSRMQALDDIEGAEAYFNAHRDEISYDAATKIEAALLEQRAIMEGGEIGEAIAGMGFSQNRAAAPQDIGMPVMGAFQVSSQYGAQRGNRRHGGVDIPTPVGTPVYAGASGVARVKRDPKGYGLYVDVKLDDGTTLRMAHLDSTNIKDGDRVEKGQVIAKSGNTGRSTGPHLHYEVIGADGTKQDPIAWHQGKPRVASQQAGASLQDQLQQLYSLNLPPRQEQEAERKIRSLHGARRDAENQEKDNVLSRAFAEIDSTGSLSAGTRSAVVAAGMGSSLSSLRSFEEATRDRRAGKTISEGDGLIAYGNARQMIAEGKINSLEDLLPLKPYLPNSYFKQLVDDVTKSPQSARQQADRAISLMNEEIEGTGLFRDKDGKQNAETRKEYARFVGAVTRQIEAERQRGPVTAEREREIVLGMVAQQVISATGEQRAGYQIEVQYRNIPAADRLRATRALQRQGIPVPSQRQVVSTWLRMQGR